ncbi:DUF6731 family protein [Clostridium sp. FP1]|uniref:DUF6731 family protein n=1 Tax=Clostridium sp. FP1 TaxID=2724076 RepID=UPI0013E917C6|nr:DUF6731 family protein [Clostridium sp. FP1]MBZ9633213.1 hypothetical protein [Clostridium sp. FP1]
MANKKSKVHYFYPMTQVGEETKLVDLLPILSELQDIAPEERLLDEGDGNIQLKKISFNKDFKKWELCFLRNKVDAPFRTRLDDDTDAAEALDEDEFIGHECCMLYDEVTGIIALQNNRNSISFAGVSQLLGKYAQIGIFLSAIVYEEKYCEILEEDGIEYKSVIIAYTDITKIRELATMEEYKSVEFLAKLTTDMSALNGKIELSVGRGKSFLGKAALKQFVNFFKKHKEITSNLKVKMVDDDTIRLIDLLSNKASDEFEISVTKDDPKTFKKILNALNAIFDTALTTTLEKCKKII